jgi:hypothetical protein
VLKININESNSQFSSKLDTWILNVGCDKSILRPREYGSAQVKSQPYCCFAPFSFLNLVNWMFDKQFQIEVTVEHE